MAAGRRRTTSTVTVAEQVAWRLVPGKGFSDSSRDPFGGRMGCHRDRNDSAAIVAEDHESIKQLEPDRRHREEVHGGNSGRVLTQESLHPWLGGRRPLRAMYLATVDCAISMPSSSVRRECAVRPTADSLRSFHE